MLEDSQPVVRESIAPLQDGAADRHIQEPAVQAVVVDHAPVFENQRTVGALAKQRAKGRLRALVDQGAVLEAGIERLKRRAQVA